MSFWPNIRDLSRIRLDLNLLRNQFVLTRCSKLGCNGVWADLRGHPPKNHLSSFWQSFWNFCKCAVPSRLSTLRKQRYMQYFISTRDRRNQFDMCASIFVCMWWEGASGAPRSQRYLPCVTSVTMGDHLPPSLLLPHVGVTDMWETTSISGSQWQMGLGTGRAYGQKLEIPEMCDLVK